MLPGDARQRGHRIDGSRRRRSGRRDDSARCRAGVAVARDQRVEGVGHHRVRRIGRHEVNVVPTEAGQQRRLVHRTMGLRRDVDDERPRLVLQAAAARTVPADPFARRDQRHQGAGRRRVLNHAGPLVRQSTHLPQPVGDDFFDLGERRARLPRQAEHAETRADVVAQHAGEQAVAREVPEEARVLPVREGRHDDAIEVRDDRLEGFGLDRRRCRQLTLDVAGFGAGHHRQRGRRGRGSRRSSRRCGDRRRETLRGSSRQIVARPRASSDRHHLTFK